MTTTTKAKALVAYYDRLMALTKRRDEMNAIRLLKRHLYTIPSQVAFMKRLKESKGSSGHLRRIKVSVRPGDGAEITLVIFGTSA